MTLTPREAHRLRWLRERLRIALSIYGVRAMVAQMARIRRAERRGRAA